MYILIIFIPLFSSSISGFFGSILGSSSAMLVTVISMICANILSINCFYEVALNGSPCYIQTFKWFDSEMLSFSWGFLFDSLTVTMLVVVTSISTCVHIYSMEYMANDPHIQRFMAYLSLFTFFMLILVTADNFFQMFLGWEGVGLCSYLLVNFWYGRIQANKAALKAIIVNRIGDIGLALGIFTIYYTFNSIDYSTVFALASSFKNHTINFFFFEVNVISLICFFFFIGATGKSAQIGLHTWLPDAMEGPTPVSALIHAATMVTAGVFLIVRCSPLFEYAPQISLIITISGSMTAFIAASIGLVQNDLKRVIAYSTCSQLGYMMIACGTSGYAASMFHLTNHAFFKALLFLSAGSIIHALSDEQDMRKMGGLLNILPFTYSMMFIGSLSLMGFPFLTGFYSKDLILEWTYSQYSINGTFAYWLGSLSAFLTAFYSMRVLSLTFLKKPLMNRIIMSHAHEPYYTMTVPLFFLSICSIFIGYFLKDMMVGLGTDFWGNSIFVLPQNALLLEAEFLNTFTKIFPVLLSLSGGIIAFILYNYFFKLIFSFKTSLVGKNLYTFLNRKWFFDKVYNELFSQHILTIAYEHGYQNIDRGIIELLGPNGFFFMYNPISTKSNYDYKLNIETIRRLKNFFKITLITLLSIFILIFFCSIQTYMINPNSEIFKGNVEDSMLFTQLLMDSTSVLNNFWYINYFKDIASYVNSLFERNFDWADIRFIAFNFGINVFIFDALNQKVPYLVEFYWWFGSKKSNIVVNVPTIPIPAPDFTTIFKQGSSWACVFPDFGGNFDEMGHHFDLMYAYLIEDYIIGYTGSAEFGSHIKFLPKPGEEAMNNIIKDKIEKGIDVKYPQNHFGFLSEAELQKALNIWTDIQYYLLNIERDYSDRNLDVIVVGTDKFWARFPEMNPLYNKDIR